MRHLWLIRHAKSSWSERGLPDFDRPLNARGERDVALMSAWLAGQQPAARWLWHSPARRTEATARGIAPAFELPDTKLCAAPELYLAQPEALLDAIRATPTEASCVALVGHNPGISQVASLLAPESGIVDFPTLGSALLSCSAVQWTDLQFGGAELVLSQHPKQLRSS